MADTAPTYSEFTTAYPTFSKLPQAYVQAKLDDAEAMENPTYWGDIFSIAVATQAAHLLSINPFGSQVQLNSDQGETVYSKYYKEVLLPKLGIRGMVL